MDRLEMAAKRLRRTAFLIAALVSLFAGAAVADDEAEQEWRQADILMQRQQYQAALPLLLDAGRRGHVRAQATLGNIYHGAKGVAKDDTIAMQWYAKAAAQGHRFAEYSLGNGYMLGLGGLPVDQVQATELFEASARQGLEDAQEAIAVSYELGRGTAHDRAKAIYWLDQASSQGNIHARGMAKILRNPNTPVFNGADDLQDFITAVFSYCWRGQFPVRRFDLDRPGVQVWQYKLYNWRNTYCN